MSRPDRILVVLGIVMLAVALVVVLARHHDAPVPPAEVRVVTVPVPMPFEKQAPIETPVEPPAPPPIPSPPAHRVAVAPSPAPVAPPPAPAAPAAVPPRNTPSASEIVALYRSVGQTLEQLDRDKGDPLRQRYRWIRLADFLVTPEKRAEAAVMLDAIASDARGK